jgi:hypothetical protein
MSKFIPLVIGGAELAAGFAAPFVGLGAISPYLISAGAGTLLSGIGTLLSKGPVNGFATTLRNPTSPWEVCYGEVVTGGVLTYIHMWGDSAKMLDMVITLAAHPCQSIDEVMFDRQRVQIDTSAAPAGAGAGSGTSFTPVQQTIVIADIARLNGVVTVQLNANIPYLTVGDQVRLTDIPGDLTLNGTFQVAQILSQIAGSPGSIKFTFLSGGINSHVINAGHCHTTWVDYGRKVYFETMLGNQTLGQTFKGMAAPGTPYDGNMGNFVCPENPGGLGGNTVAAPNPWTANCSQVGKTMVFLRLHFSDQYFQGGLPQISFRLHGKNDIIDTRTSPFTVGYTANSALCIADFLSNQTWGFKAVYGGDMPLADLNAAANVCDEAVPLAIGGSPPATEPAYTCNGKFPVTMRRGEILQNLLTSCAGRISDHEPYIIYPAAYFGVSFALGSNPGGSVVSLPAFNSIAAGPIKWHQISIRDLYNGVKGTYISPANKWQAADFPPYCQDALHGYAGPSLYGGDINLAADGGDRRWLDIQLPFTNTASTAQRIAKIELLRRRHFEMATLILNMYAYQIARLDIGLFTIPQLQWVAKQFEVTAIRLRLEGGSGGGAIPLTVELDLQGNDAAIYQWSTSEELSPQGYVQPAIPGIGSRQFFATEGTPGFSFPYPWSPGYVVPFVGDALYPGPLVGSPPVSEALASFGMQVQYGTDANGNPNALLQIKGAPSINRLSSIQPPQITCVVGTAGSLPPGQYVVAATAYDTNSPYQNSAFSTPVIVTIPASSPPADNGSIAVTVAWPASSNGGDLYMAFGAAANGYHYQAHLSSASTTATIAVFDQATSGGPDPTFDHFAVAWKKVIHGGVWAQQVQAVTATTITIGGGGMTLNQWAGYVLTLLAKEDQTIELPILNMPVASSTASSGSPSQFVLTIGPDSAGKQLPDLSTLLVPGDLVLMRFKALFTPTSFYDPNISNPYFPGGATDTNVEPGHLVMVLTGVDAGDVQTVGSIGTDGMGNDTIFRLAGPWQTQPNPGDIVTIVDGIWSPEVQSDAFQVPNKGAFSGVVAAPLVQNLANQTWIFIVRTETVDDVSGPDSAAPVREVYFFGSQGTRTITTSQTMLATDGIIDVNASGGNVIYTLLPFAQIPNQSVYVQKIDASANTVTIACAVGDTINGQSSVILSNQWDYVVFTVSGN